MHSSQSFAYDRIFSPLLGASRLTTVGTGSAIAHHGEILQGVFPDEAGHLHRGLITLPCSAFESVITYWPDDSGELRTRPTGMNKAARAARLTFELLGQKNAEGALRLKRMFRSV